MPRFRPFFLRCLRLFTCMQLRLSKTCLPFTFLTTNALLMETRTLPDQSLVLLPSDSAFTCSLYIEIKRKQANWRFANTLRSSIWVLWCKSFLTCLFEKDKWQNSRDPLQKDMTPLHTIKPKSSPKPGYKYYQPSETMCSLTTSQSKNTLTAEFNNGNMNSEVHVTRSQPFPSQALKSLTTCFIGFSRKHKQMHTLLKPYWHWNKQRHGSSALRWRSVMTLRLVSLGSSGFQYFIHNAAHYCYTVFGWIRTRDQLRSHQTGLNQIRRRF